MGLHQIESWFSAAPAGPAARLRRELGLPFVLAALCCAALLVLGRLGLAEVEALRWRLSDLLAPVTTAARTVMRPIEVGIGRLVATYDAIGELERLHSENQRLEGWRWRALELERQLDDLERMTRLVEVAPVRFLTAYVLASPAGTGSSSIVIGAGRLQGVRPGHPVTDGNGLLGLVVEAGERSARVMLVTDRASRIPVMLATERAIARGDGGDDLRIELAPVDALPEEGALVATSDAGGILPAGLKVGAVVEVDGARRVRPIARLGSQRHVGVLLYDSPALELADPSGGGAGGRLAGHGGDRQ